MPTLQCPLKELEPQSLHTSAFHTSVFLLI
jgi:hypothetical protein